MEKYDKKVLYKDDKFLNFMQTQCPNGKKWSYVKRINSKGVVIIVPLITDLAEPSTVFLKTKRPALIAENISEYNIEFPAGLVGDENNEETFEEAMKKELLEETGLEASKFVIKTNKLSSSAGCTSEVSALAIAYVNNSQIKSKPISDGGIIQERILISSSEIENFIESCNKNGYSIGAQTLAGVYYLYNELLTHF